MSDNKKEGGINNSDGEDKIQKPSVTEENENKSVSNKDEESKSEELTPKEKIILEESSKALDVEPEDTSNADSDVTTTPGDSKPPVSVCFKETNEAYSEEGIQRMFAEVKDFFENLKELQSKRAAKETSKRKFESTLEDSSDGKSDSSHSEECSQPAKKLLLDASAMEGISSQQSQIDRPDTTASVTPENVGPPLPNTSETVKNTHQEPMDTESHSSPRAGTSSEDSSSTSVAPGVPESEDNPLISQSETSQPADSLPNEDYGHPFVELNGVRTRHFPGTIEVQIIVPLVQCFLNDLLELRLFLEGQEVSSAAPLETTSSASSEVSYSDRQLAAITDEFGTGVESEPAILTRKAVTEWDTKYISKGDSEALSGISERSEYSEDSSSGSSTHQNEIRDNSESPTLSPDSISSSPETNAAVLPTKPSPSSPEIEQIDNPENKESSKTENPAQPTESESISNKITENSTNQTPITNQTSEGAQRFHADLDHLNLPSEISPLVRALNAKGRRLLNSCIVTSKNFLRTCLTEGADSFQGQLLQHLREMLDTMRRLISIREECSDLLKKSPDKNSITGVTYILKIKYYIAKVFNQCLEDMVGSNNSLEVVKELAIDSVD